MVIQIQTKIQVMLTKKLFLFGLLLLILSSCNSVYFTEPQPVNSKNIYEFPSKYHGVWMEGEDTVVISKNVYKSVSYREGNLLKSFADTSSNHVLANGRIYFIQKEDRMKLTGGFPYVVRNDTLFYKNREVIEVFLGGNTFLRKVADKHVLNIKSDDLWWELVLVEKAKDGSVIGRRITNEEMEAIEGIKPIWSSENVFYYDVKWLEHDLSGLIRRGFFNDTIVSLSIDSKIRKRRNIR